MPLWKPRIGFIGLGNQGAPIAQRIIDAGFSTTLWARRAESLQAFDKGSFVAVNTPSELAANSDLVCICVVDDAGTTEIANAVIEGMSEGGIIAIHSTVHPSTCQQLEKKAIQKGIHLIDAPVSGGSEGATAGNLTVMMGGDAQVIEKCEPIFSAFASHSVRLGEVGAGQLCKLVNNSLMAANMRLAHDAVQVGLTLGLDQQALMDVVASGSGASFSLNVYKTLSDFSDFEAGAKLLRKDIKLLDNVLKQESNLSEQANKFLDCFDLKRSQA